MDFKSFLFYAKTNTFISCAYAEENANSGQCGDNLTWTLNSEGTLEISGTGEMYEYDRERNTPPWMTTWREVIIRVQESFLLLDRTGKSDHVRYKRTAEYAGISVQAVYNMRDEFLSNQ